MFCEFKKSCIEIAKKHKDDLLHTIGGDTAVKLYLEKAKKHVVILIKFANFLLIVYCSFFLVALYFG